MNFVKRVLVVTSVNPPSSCIRHLANGAAENSIPFVILFTKSDKCKKLELAKNLTNYESKLSEQWEDLPLRILTSAEKRIGKKEILEYMEKYQNSIQSN